MTASYCLAGHVSGSRCSSWLVAGARHAVLERHLAGRFMARLMLLLARWVGVG